MGSTRNIRNALRKSVAPKSGTRRLDLAAAPARGAGCTYVSETLTDGGMAAW
jgi:hypothetical protein